MTAVNEDDEANETETTIGLFGATGRTGTEFRKLALQKGYRVKALVRDPSKVSSSQHENLEIVQGSIDQPDKLQQVVSGSQYVVCMVAAPSGNDASYQTGFMTNFIKLLCPILEKEKPRVFLYQAGSMSTDGDGRLHPASFVAKHTYGRKLGILSKISDNDNAIQYLKKHSTNDGGGGYHFIVTRAGVLVDGPPTGRAIASQAWPPLPYWNSMTFGDLAAFTLQAIQDESLYDTCPYVR